jgi:aspartate 1-decarboxylase
MKFCSIVPNLRAKNNKCNQGAPPFANPQTCEYFGDNHQNRNSSMRIYLRSKIHKATITDANLHYVGSITIDKRLMELADLNEYEKVLVVDNTNGQRLETYVITGKKNSGAIGINGAAAHLMHKGDEVIIMSFQISNRPKKPINILVDNKNKFVKYLKEKSEMRDCDGC